MTEYLITVHGALSALFWLIVAVGAALAVFHPKIWDTPLERIALSCICLGCVGAAWRIVSAGWVSDGGLWLSGSFALYVGAIVHKHSRPTPPHRPVDKTKPGELDGVPPQEHWE